MARQFDSLTPDINKMTDLELRDFIAETRRRKYQERAAKVKHTEKAEAPARKVKVNKVKTLLSTMSDTDKQEFIKLLKGHSDE